MKKLLTTLLSTFISLIVLLLVPTTTFAATYYVDNTCSNNGNGSDQTCASGVGQPGPFNSISNVQSKSGGYSPGDSILLKRGLTFAEALTFTWSGSSGNVITIGAYGTGSNPKLNPNLSQPLYLNGSDYVTIDSVDFETSVADSVAIRQANGNDNIVITNVTASASKYAMYSQNTTTNQSISNSTFIATAASGLYGLYFFGTNNQNITISEVSLTGGIIRFTNIINADITNIVSSGANNNGSGVILIQNGSGTLNIDSVTSTSAKGSGVDIMNSNYTEGNASVSNIQHSSSTNPLFTGIYVNGSTYIDFSNLNISGVGKSGLLVSNSSYINFSDFTVSGVGENGVLVNNGSHHITFTDGLAENNLGDGMDTADSAHDVTFLRCIARNNGTRTESQQQASGDGFSTHDTNYNINFINVISHNNTNTAFALWGTSSGTIYNSIGYNNGGDWTSDGGFPTVRGGLAANLSGTNPTTGETFQVKNSVFMNNYPVEVHTTNFWLGQSAANYNIYNPLSDSDFYNLTSNPATLYSWTQYHVNNNYESASMNSDPLFEDVGTNFHLQSGSPAINAGMDVSLLVDYDGISVPQGASPDIGAYEFILPSSGSSLTQYRSDGIIAMTTGSTTTEDDIVLKLTMSSTNDSDSLTPQLEVRPVGDTFTNTVTHSGSAVSYNGSAVTGTVSVSGLSDGTYHWQARVSNSAGQSSWVSYGGNAESATDFQVDATIPTISAVDSSVTSSGATITWTTDENSSSKIDYGLTSTYGSTTSETDTSPRVTSHSVSLSGLQACSIYHYRVRSKDAATNERVGSDNTFTTSGCTGSSSVQASDTQSITTASGGSVDLIESSTGIALTVPAGFAGSDANFQIKRLEKTATLNSTSSPTGYSLIANYLYDMKALSDVNTLISSFNNALTVTMTYTSADITGIQESTLKIYRWDGSSWSALSNCTVNTSAKTVTCSTTAFSVFGLFGQVSTSSGSSSNSNSSSSDDDDNKECRDDVGIQPPWAYGAIAQDSNSIMLYFTEAADPVDRYAVKYGIKSGDYIYGADKLPIKSESRMTYIVKDLQPNTTYYFKVRGGNGCKPGDWSNEIKATTKPNISYNNLQFTNSTLEAAPVETKTEEPQESTSCQTHTVSKGDTLMGIANKFYANSSKYKDIVEENKDTYPTLEKSNNLEVGWKLNIDCNDGVGGKSSDETSSTESDQTVEGYKVKVKVLNEQDQPVAGAKVTMHSKVQEATTDKNGIAVFENVEKGDHRVIIAYNGFE